MESGGFSHGAAFHPAFLPKLPSYKQTPWTAPPAHYSSLTRRGVALCCVALGFPPRLTFSTHIWKVSREHLRGVKFFSRWYVRLLQRKKKKKKAEAASDSVFLHHAFPLHLSVTYSVRLSLSPSSGPVCLCKHCLPSTFLSRHEEILPKTRTSL